MDKGDTFGVPLVVSVLHIGPPRLAFVFVFCSAEASGGGLESVQYIPLDRGGAGTPGTETLRRRGGK